MEIASAPAPTGSVACASAPVDDARVVPWSDVPRVARRSAGGSSNDGLTACSNAAAAALALTLNPLPGSQHTQTTSSPRPLYIPPPQRHHHNSALQSALSPALCLSALHAPRPACTPPFQSPADTWRASLPFHGTWHASGGALLTYSIARGTWHGHGNALTAQPLIQSAAPHSQIQTARPFSSLLSHPLAQSLPQLLSHSAAAASGRAHGRGHVQQLVGAYHSAAATDGSQAVSKFEEVGPVDPFSLVADELKGLADKMRAMILSEIPKLATAADYFFRVGATGKRFRPTVILLMASSLEHAHCTPVVALSGAPGVPLGGVPVGEVFTAEERRERQRRIAEITEMIHVASLLHDDVLDHADTRRGVSSLNYMMGNKLAVLAGDFLLARASAALAGLRNTEVVELLSAVLEHLVGGEVMQMTAEPTQCSSMEYYMRKTFLKTASLMANSCKAVAVLGAHDAPTAHLAYDYGRHLGLAFQLVDDALDFTGSLSSLGKPALNDIAQGLVTAPVLFAAEQHPGMHRLMDRKFSHPGDVQQAVAWVEQSGGVARTKALAAEHCALAVQAVQAMPAARTQYAHRCRLGLIELTHLVLSRSK
ncbi:unnamed protein product [Closterium sp. Naga37s-1]|nr:unnamed protein product [Closterium sp. Naga37s-1]